MILRIASSLFLILLIFSCDLDPGDTTPLPQPIQVGEATKSFPDVDQRLWVYFERFENAGIERGINIDLANENVTGIIGEEPGHVSPGACNTDSNNSLHQVSLREDFWETASVTNKEIIVFHELGHCFLERGHLDDIAEDGFCVSLMRTGGGVCTDNYFQNTRKYYLDELFRL